MAKNTKKATNAGVNAITGFALQRNTALYLILDKYDSKYKDANYFVCIEHHEDCLICFLDKSNSIKTIEAYQSKKKSTDSWTLNNDFIKIIEKILCTGKDLICDTSYPKSEDYIHFLFFVTNQTVNLKKSSDSISIKEDNVCVKYNDLPSSIKDCIKQGIKNEDLHDELEKTSILWIDLSRIATNQEDQLVGKIERIFGDKIESARAALKLILELFRNIESTYNDNNVASLLDETKRVTSNEINQAFNIITTQSKCFTFWREQKSQICKSLEIPVKDRSLFQFHFESAFDYFKLESNAEYIQIKNFVIENFNSIDDAYDEVEMVVRLIDLLAKSRMTNLDNLQLKAVFFAAYFEANEIHQN